MTALTERHQIIRIVVKRVSINVMDRQRVTTGRIVWMPALFAAPIRCILHPLGDFVPVLWIAAWIKGHYYLGLRPRPCFTRLSRQGL